LAGAEIYQIAIKDKLMKNKLMLLFCVLPVIGAEPAGYKYWSAAELKGFATKLAPKVNAQKFGSERLTDYGNHYTMVAHREGNGEAELHETESDLFVVTSGTATLIVGGTLQNGKTTAPNEIRGPSVEGGMRQKLSAGDIVHIPPKTAHQLVLEPGAEFTYFVLKVKE
jgi:mannose-6-phosphate isomerase-like protein (cupin superfamily)